MREWTGCYDGSWKGVITPAAFAHPAKFSKALVERILDYMLDRGWIAKGDLVGDPFGGVGCGGLAAAYRGLQWYGLELEPKFVKLAFENFRLHIDRLSRIGLPLPVIDCGDSRQFDVKINAAGAMLLAYSGTTAVVSSPPYVSGGHHTDAMKGGKPDYPGRVNHPERVEMHTKKHKERRYGLSKGQIGVTKGETYWEAMKQVYEACFRALKPGGVMALVVKDFVKDKQRVCLCDDTMKLLKHIGFVELERIHAMLVEESAHEDLFAGTVTKRKERKSFWRRLSESKGAPRIDYEEVLFVRKPI